MDDQKIVELYWARSEAAISETAAKYGGYCRSIAYRILRNEADSEECVNDAYLRAWNAIPPARPEKLSAFLGKLTRNLSLDRYRLHTREKRGGGQVEIALDELRDCVPAENGPERAVDGIALTQLLNRFLASQPAGARKIFMQRYWYLLSIKEIAAGLGVSESKVKMSLLRSRNELKTLLETEGILL